MTKQARLSEVQTIPIADLVPYENNPRRIPQTAIDSVARSIELFGWQQPIIVDKDMVIVVGHTRRLAALQLGLKEVPVYVTDLSEDKIKEYRLVDNRTGEYSEWDHNALVLELREFEQGLLESFFPEIDLEIVQIGQATGVTEDEMKWAEKRVTGVTQASSDLTHLTEVVCPSCFHTFSVRTHSLPGMDRYAVEDMVNGGTE